MASKTILRETATLTTIKENRLKASFTMLESADRPAADELDGDARSSSSYAGDLRREDLRRRGPDADPASRRTFPRIVQSGIAIAVGRFKKPVPRFSKYCAAEPSVHAH